MACRSQAFSLFRQCSAARTAAARQSSSRVSSSAVPLTAFRAGARRRPYSTESSKEDQEKVAESEKKNEDASSSKESGKEGEKEQTECEKKLKAKEDEVTDLTSRLRYLQADFLNLQRNAAREKEHTKDFAITRFAGDLLETVDVLSLALKSVPENALKVSADSVPDATVRSSSDTSAPAPASTKPSLEYLQELHTGVEATHRMLLSTLFRYGVKPHDPTGETFDPNRHEALYQAPVPGKTPGTVIQCQKVGYTIKDRVLRAAQVGVASEGSS